MSTLTFTTEVARPALGGRLQGMGRRREPMKVAIRATADDVRQGENFGLWFRSAMDQAGFNVPAVARMAVVKSPTRKSNTISRQYLYTLENNCIDKQTGEYKRPSQEMIRAISEVLGADTVKGLKAAGWDADVPVRMLPAVLEGLDPTALDYLSKAARIMTSADTIIIPIVGKVGAGESVMNSSHVRERLPIPRKMIPKLEESVAEVFGVKVEGDCLGGLNIANEDVLICKVTSVARDGEIVIVLDGDDAVAKRYRELPSGRRWLETVPSTGNGVRVEVSEDARIIGVAISMFRPQISWL